MSQVNLLPPELRARQKAKQLTTLIIGAGAAVIVLLLAFWFLQSQKLAGVNDDIAAQNLTNSGLQTQIDQLQEFQQLQEEAAAQEALLATAWVGEVSFSQMLMDLSRTIPSGRVPRFVQRDARRAGGRRVPRRRRPRRSSARSRPAAPRTASRASRAG